MREAIGGTWIFSIVVVFIVLFSSYLAISVNYSKAFRVKNEIISIIEKYEGHNADAQTAVAGYLDDVGYNTYADCGRYGEPFIKGPNTNRYKYCIKKENSIKDTDTLKKTYYTVTVFFRLDLPIFREIFTFAINGETKSIYFAKD